MEKRLILISYTNCKHSKFGISISDVGQIFKKEKIINE